LRPTLEDKNRSVDSNRLVRVRFIVRTDGSCRGDKSCTGEAEKKRELVRGSCDRGNVKTSLIPVVTATCPNKLNQPVTQDAKGAPWGLEIMAAQKYGPPLVGCALHISGAACHKTFPFRACRVRTCHSQANQHREEGCLTSS
jgi:hypothetical protein